MKTIIQIGIVIIMLCFIVIPVQAQSDRVYEPGSVWSVAYVETKPGHFDDYLSDLSNVWKKFMDEQIQLGDVLSYKILSISAPRDNEPDLILLVEYKNWAVFDKPYEYTDNIIEKIMGSLDKSNQANIKREELRELRGSQNAIELIFKK